jgi:ribonuclease P protein component
VGLPKANRLRKRQDFNQVYQKGRRCSTRCFALCALRSNLDLQCVGDTSQLSSPARIGISVSQKVSKHAVVRNRLKRQVRAILSRWLPYISTGWDLVLVVRPPAKECDYTNFLQELEQLLVTAEVVRDGLT